MYIHTHKHGWMDKWKWGREARMYKVARDPYLHSSNQNKFGKQKTIKKKNIYISIRDLRMQKDRYELNSRSK